MAVICNRRNSSRYLWSVLIILTIVACGTFVYISLSFGKYFQSEARSLKVFSSRVEKLAEEKCTSVCNSEECVLHSNVLLNHVETAADPCENFFEFACGKYAGQFWNESRLFFVKPFSTMEIALKNVVEIIDSDPGSASGKLKTVYDSCIKHRSSDFQAIPTLLQYLTRFGIPGWPNLESDFKFAEPSLIKVLGNFLTYQEYGFIRFAKYKKKNEVPCSQFNATIKPSEGSYEQKRKSVRKYLVDSVLQYFNLDSEIISEIWEESEVIHDAVAHLKEESKRIQEEDKPSTTVDCAKDNETEWKPVCELLESFVEISDVTDGVSNRFTAVEEDSVYFMQNIIPVLSNFSDRSIANYLTLNLLFNHLDELNFHFQLASLKDPGPLSRFFPLDIRHSRLCIEWLTENMFIPLGHAYMENVFTESAMQEVVDLIEECIREIADAIFKQLWMTEAVRTEYAQQVGNITNYISKLNVLRNETVLNNLYDQFRPTEVSFLQNVFEHRRFFNVKKMLGFLDETNLSEMKPDFLRPGASGSPWNLDISLGILWPPAFRPGLQRLINLVTFAVTAAHEIGHGLHQGFYQLEDVAPSEKEYMKTRILCIKNQYSQFKYEHLGIHMDGSRTIIEDFPDTVAISIIDKLIERHASEDNVFFLPGFPHSLKQLLYISAAQFWCGSFTKQDEEINYYHHEIHSLGNFRLLGMMQNSKRFAEAFSCPEGSFMNPSNKCLFPE